MDINFESRHLEELELLIQKNGKELELKGMEFKRQGKMGDVRVKCVCKV